MDIYDNLKKSVVMTNLLYNKPITFYRYGIYYITKHNFTKLKYEVVKRIKAKTVEYGFRYCTYEHNGNLHQGFLTTEIDWLKVRDIKRLKHIKWRKVKKYKQLNIFEMIEGA